jgi:hypothetical protein
MNPIRPGSAASFWATICGVTLPGTPPASPTIGQLNGPVALRDGECVYARQGLHGQRLYHVPEAEVMKSFPFVTQELERRAISANPNDFVARAYARWKETASPNDMTPQRLFDLIADELLSQIRSYPPMRAYPLAGDSVITAREDFRRSLDKADFYWATTLFEFIFLSALLIYVIMPLARNRPGWRLVAHWATAPVLFYAPFWLGYASRTRSPWGPNGGIVYPWLLWFSGQPAANAGWENAGWELGFFKSMPPLLSPISQDISGPIVSLTGSSIPGPLYASYIVALCGLTAATIIFVPRFMGYRRRRRRERLRGVICLNCGYDLRASAGSCPECGTPIPVKRQLST